MKNDWTLGCEARRSVISGLSDGGGCGDESPIIPAKHSHSGQKEKTKEEKKEKNKKKNLLDLLKKKKKINKRKKIKRKSWRTPSFSHSLFLAQGLEKVHVRKRGCAARARAG